jgi:hypothetical protein
VGILGSLICLWSQDIFTSPKAAMRSIAVLTTADEERRRVVNLSLMDIPREQSAEALQSALRAARDNENRWVEMSPEFSSDSERMEQWTSTAKLRRHEVERIEALLANATEPSGLPQPVCNEAVETLDRLGETE